MEKKKSVKVTIALTIALIISTSLLEASYYQDTLFPIGLSGIMVTKNKPTSYACPYGDEGWTWQGELQLISNLGINCIGSEDCWPTYLADLKPTNPSQNNYLHQVCAKASPSKPVYLIIANYYAQERWYAFPPPMDTMQQYLPYHCCEGVECNWHFQSSCITPPECKWTGYTKNERPCIFFRSPHRPEDAGNAGGVGSMLFPLNGWYKHGTHYQNWNTFDGDDRWRWMADTAVGNFKYHFLNNPTDAQYIWGYNLISEDPAVSEGGSSQGHGCWAAVDRIFTGHRGTSEFTNLTPASHDGIRGAESAVMGGTRRMFVAKGGRSPNGGKS